MYLERMQCFGIEPICHWGATIYCRYDGQRPNTLPKDLLADEKHTWINGEKIYATTVAKGLLLGVGIAQSVWRR